jgi:hypothetical protein
MRCNKMIGETLDLFAPCFLFSERKEKDRLTAVSPKSDGLFSTI